MGEHFVQTLLQAVDRVGCVPSIYTPSIQTLLLSLPSALRRRSPIQVGPIGARSRRVGLVTPLPLLRARLVDGCTDDARDDD